MEATVRNWLTATTLIIAFLVGGLLGLICWPEATAPAGNRIEYWKFYLEFFSIVLIGFFVAMLGVLIPRGFSKTKYAFERLKESRIAFSRAKTGVDYLPVRLCGLPLKTATSVMQNTHVWKHRAELYSELAQHLLKRGDNVSPSDWGDLMYEQLNAIRCAVERNSANWDSMPPEKRLAELKDAQRKEIAKWKEER